MCIEPRPDNMLPSNRVQLVCASSDKKSFLQTRRRRGGKRELDYNMGPQTLMFPIWYLNDERMSGATDHGGDGEMPGCCELLDASQSSRS